MKNRYLDQILLGVLYTLGDRCRYLASLAKSVTYYSVLVTYNYNRRKRKSTSSLGNLRYALDAYQTILELQIACPYFLYVRI